MSKKKVARAARSPKARPPVPKADYGDEVSPEYLKKLKSAVKSAAGPNVTKTIISSAGIFSK